MSTFSESTVEVATLAWLEGIGWQITHGPEIAPDIPAAERPNYGEVVFTQRLRDALLPKLIFGWIRVKDTERFLERTQA